jgi:UDP-2,4-diacetamido-2,4,6-trideoxy-beta-L-altropyranose hydrolase
MDQNLSGSLLLVRAEASPAIGTGHVLRMLALAQAWQARGGRAVFLFAQPNEPMRQRIEQEGGSVVVLHQLSGSQADAEAVIHYAKTALPAWIALDGYDFGTNYLKSLAATEMPVLLTTDYVQAEHLPVTVLLNQNPHARVEDYATVAPKARLLLGLQYLMLRNEFRVWKSRRPVRSGKIARLLVTFGGADPVNATEKVVRALAGKLLPNLQVKVLIGSNNVHAAAIRAAVAQAGSHYQSLERVTDMPALLAETDMAICAAGSTCWEMAYMGVPMLAVILAENQAPLAVALEQLGLGRNLGWHHELAFSTIPDQVQQWAGDAQGVAAMARRGPEAVDGDGVVRVLDCLPQARAAQCWEKSPS